MEVPRKGSRTLTIEGHGEFRYIVGRGAPVYDSDLDDNYYNSKVTVQENSDKPGRVVQCEFPYGQEVTPTTVIALVQSAIKEGWDPTERGAAFTLSKLSHAVLLGKTSG